MRTMGKSTRSASAAGGGRSRRSTRGGGRRVKRAATRPSDAPVAMATPALLLGPRGQAAVARPSAREQAQALLRRQLDVERLTADLEALRVEFDEVQAQAVGAELRRLLGWDGRAVGELEDGASVVREVER